MDSLYWCGEQEIELDDAIAASTLSNRVIRAGYLQGESLVDAYRCADLPLRLE